MISLIIFFRQKNPHHPQRPPKESLVALESLFQAKKGVQNEEAKNRRNKRGRYPLAIWPSDCGTEAWSRLLNDPKKNSKRAMGRTPGALSHCFARRLEMHLGVSGEISPEYAGRCRMSAPARISEWTQHRLDISKATMNKPPSQKYIVGHLPDEPGNYGLIIGPDGMRKSWVVLHIAIAVAGGRPVAEGPQDYNLWPAPSAGRVVYITSEDSAEVMHRRVWSIAQMPGYECVQDLDEFLDILPVYSNMTLLTTAQDGSIVQTPEFKELVEYARGSRLIIIDPLADVFDLDENGNREGRAIVQVLRQLSIETGAGVIGVHHQNKASMLSRETNHQSGRGSSKIGAGCRWAVVLQSLSADDAVESEIENSSDWTTVHESKANYANEPFEERLLHKIAVVDDNGQIIASAPVADVLPNKKFPPSCKNTEVKYATAY